MGFSQIRPIPAIFSEKFLIPAKTKCRYQQDFPNPGEIFHIPAWFSRFWQRFFFPDFDDFFYSGDPPNRSMLILTQNRLNRFFRQLVPGSSTLHPTPAGGVQVGPKTNPTQPVNSPSLINQSYIINYVHAIVDNPTKWKTKPKRIISSWHEVVEYLVCPYTR